MVKNPTNGKVGHVRVRIDILLLRHCMHALMDALTDARTDGRTDARTRHSLH